MDSDRFDRLAKRMGASTSRRAALGGVATAGLLSALGLQRTVLETRAAQGGTCVVAFAAQVLQGPSVELALTPNGGRAGEVRGDLSFSLSASGNLENASLALPDGAQLPVVGQATGHSLQVRIELEPRVALVAIGIGEREIAECRGAIDGVTAGPQVGDLGDWHAAGVQQARGGGRANADNSSGGGRQSGGGSGQGGRAAAGNRTDRGGRNADQGQAQGAGQNNPGSSTGSSSGSASGANAQPCPPGQTFCDDSQECRDLNNDPGSCGACGTRCPDVFCRNGRCLTEEEAEIFRATLLNCDEGMVFCDLEDGYCADLLTNSLNCGACGYVCPSDSPFCSAGNCFEAQDVEGQEGCGGLNVRCNGGCIDLFTDADHCGSCGNICPVTPEIYNCEGGVCVAPTCDPLLKCGQLCVDPLSNSLHCGGCDLACAEGTTCVDGACNAIGGGGCLVGLTDCGGVCVDTSTDLYNCGGCDLPCAEGTTCLDGACSASGGGGCLAGSGLTYCGGQCVDTVNDHYNCGVCGNQCPPPSGYCLAGTCTYCPIDMVNCGGACFNAVSDFNNCGACGNVCQAPATACAGGVCV